jgi:hypothetical protein
MFEGNLCRIMSNRNYSNSDQNIKSLIPFSERDFLKKLCCMPSIKGVYFLTLHGRTVKFYHYFPEYNW